MPTMPSIRRLSLRLPRIRLGRPSTIAIVVLAMLGALLAGQLVMMFSFNGVLYAIGLLVGLWLLALVVAGSDEHYDWVFYTLLAGLFVVPLLFKTFVFSLNTPYQLFILTVGLGCVGTLIRKSLVSRALGASMLCFALFLGLGVLTSVVGRSNAAGAAFQFLSDLKPLFLVAIGYRLAWSERTESIFWNVIHWYWLPALFFIAFEWTAPGLHNTVFPGTTTSADASGLLPSRAMGTFEHPSFLANVAVVMALACWARARESVPMNRRYVGLMVVYLLLLFATSSRGEQAGFMLAIFVGMVMLSARLSWGRLAAITLIVGLSVSLFWLIFADTILKEAAAWGIGTVGPVAQPRAQILVGALNLANRYFPLGTGLGTYGGAGAEKFDLSLYFEMGFGNYWWFRREDYLMDTYWPNSIAETGYIGALLLLASYVLLAVHAFIRARRSQLPRARTYWALACCGMCYLLFNSTSSPTFQDPRLFLLVAVMFGIGERWDSRQKALQGQAAPVRADQPRPTPASHAHA